MNHLTPSFQETLLLPINVKSSSKHRIRLSLQHGFTLTEAMVIVFLIGISSLIAIPNFVELLSDYRLNVGGRQVVTALQFARAKAVSENFNMTVSMVSGSDLDTYSIAGGEDDQGDGLNPWEDRNDNGTVDSISYNSQNLPNKVQYDTSDPVPSILTGYSTTSTLSVTFSPLGVPRITSNNVIVYLKNERNKRAAVTVERTGRIRMWRLKDGSWEAL